MMSGPMRTLSKGNKPWSSGSDNRGLLFEFWLGVMATVQMGTDICFWRILSTDRDRRPAHGTTDHPIGVHRTVNSALEPGDSAQHGSAI
jgi:hypothetical protein